MKKRIFCAVCTFLVVAAAAILPCFASIDWTSYTSSNLLPLPYTSGAPGSVLTTNGVTWTINEDASITFTGTSTADVFFWLAEIPLESGQYNYHSEVTGTSTGLWVGWDTNNGSVYDSEGTFYASSSNPYRFYLALQSGKAYNFTAKVMLNRTATAYPYQPYIPYYIQEASNQQYNYFSHATFLISADSGEYDSETYTLYTPSLITNGISFENVYNWVNTLDGTPADWSVTIDIYWDSEYTWDYLSTPIYISVDRSTVNAYIVSQNQYLNVDIDTATNTARPIAIDPGNTIVYPVKISALNISSLPAASVQTLTLTTFADVYDKGYATGYNEGVKANNQTIYNEGKTDGYKNGYIEGKADGLSLSETGDWRSLISAVIEAPVNVFQDLFSFEILGMDMRAAVGAVLAICVILIIIKKVIL